MSNRPVKERIRKPSDDVRRGREPPGAKGAVKVYARANGCERRQRLSGGGMGGRARRTKGALGFLTAEGDDEAIYTRRLRRQVNNHQKYGFRRHGENFLIFP